MTSLVARYDAAFPKDAPLEDIDAVALSKAPKSSGGERAPAAPVVEVLGVWGAAFAIVTGLTLPYLTLQYRNGSLAMLRGVINGLITS